MTPRALYSVMLSAAALSLTACAAVDPTPTDPPRPASIDGEWVVERAVTAATDEVAVPVGSTSTLYLLFTEEDCDDTTCTGTVISGTSLEDREANASHGTYRHTADELTYEFPDELRACVADDGGTVIAEGAYADSVTYSGAITSTDEDRITAFSATGVRTSRITAIGAGTGVCRPVDGEIEYELTATRGG